MPNDLPDYTAAAAATQSLLKQQTIPVSSTQTMTGLTTDQAVHGIMVLLASPGNVTNVTITGEQSGVVYWNGSSSPSFINRAVILSPIGSSIDTSVKVAVTTNASGSCVVFVIAIRDLAALVLIGAGGTTLGDTNVNVDSWGGTTTNLGQHPMASSVPVVMASDQSDVPVNIDKYGGTVTTLGQKVMASSLPVALASDQSRVPVTPGAALAMQSAAFNPTITTGSSVTLVAAVGGQTVTVYAASFRFRQTTASNTQEISLQDTSAVAIGTWESNAGATANTVEPPIHMVWPYGLVLVLGRGVAFAVSGGGAGDTVVVSGSLAFTQG